MVFRALEDDGRLSRGRQGPHHRFPLQQPPRDLHGLFVFDDRRSSALPERHVKSQKVKAVTKSNNQ